MKALLRFALHAVLPPLGGWLFIVGVFGITSIGRIPPGEILRGVFVGLILVYVCAWIPSVIYAVVMEFAAWRGVKPGSRRAVWLSAGLGCIAAALLLVARGGSRDWPALVFTSVVGFVVGLAVEWFIGQLEAEITEQNSLRDESRQPREP
ncbi:MAG TPA: hypothetical protein VGE76_13395 [Opitutaceae bacterium]